MEIWKKIKGTQYSVSNQGQVRNDTKGTILTPRKVTKGYIQYRLYRDGTSTYKRGHRLVAEAFLDNPNGLPQVDHLNGIKDDNRLCNLEWVTNTENVNRALNYCFELETPDGTKVAGYGLTAFCKRHGLQPSNLSKVISGSRKTTKGFKLWQS